MAEQADSESSLLLVALQHQEQREQKDEHKGVPDQLMYKNRLQEYTQRACIPFPVYYTINEAEPRHPPKYKSTVEVDGEKYTCLHTFSNRKAAEQDASKIALESMSKKIKNFVFKKTAEGGFSPVFQDKVFCKSILKEFADKMNVEKPKYDTVKVDGLFPVFASSLIFDGVKYSGQTGVNKKEAEQFAARSAILSILANPVQGMQLSKIVKSKAKLFSAVHEHTSVGDSTIQPVAGHSHGTSAIRDSVGTTEGIGNVELEVPQGEPHVPPKHEFRKPGLEICTPADPLPIAFVPPMEAQVPLATSVCGEKRKNKKKKKKKASKKAKLDVESQVLPVSQEISFTVALSS